MAIGNSRKLISCTDVVFAIKLSAMVAVSQMSQSDCAAEGAQIVSLIVIDTFVIHTLPHCRADQDHSHVSNFGRVVNVARRFT